MRKILSSLTMIAVAVSLGGCTLIYKKQNPSDKQTISQLKQEVTTAEEQKRKLEAEIDDLERAKRELERRFQQEIADKDVKVEMLEKGLVVTFVDQILFDSGKAELKKSAFANLDKVARVLKTTVKDLNVGIEGHTDNVPIKYSGWKSNWELSAARAMSVLHYLDEHGIEPVRLSAIGYGEYQPVADNTTKEGRQQNRRVEVVILPKMAKVK
jgi:chemotaxis protein MotB